MSGAASGGLGVLTAGSLAVFTSAFLLFLVQPLAARLLQPAFGGSPSVWNTALVFFQAVLLTGYAYAHWNAIRLRPNWRVPVHLLIVTAPLLLLPPSAEAAGSGAPGAWPVPWVLLALATAVGLPFFALASNTSLTQSWLSPALVYAGRDPYRLYAASNAGSLLALLAYPWLLEPNLGLSDQARLWSLGYGLFVVLTVGVIYLGHIGRGQVGDSAVRALNSKGPESEMGSDHAPSLTVDQPARETVAEAPSRRRRVLWLLRSGVISSLLLSVTLAITTDIIAMPLLWVLPLGVYLMTFVLAFALPDRLPRRPLVLATALSIAVALPLHVLPLAPSLAAQLVLSLSPLALGGLLCHLDLARDRPAPRYLTSFYLYLALGGVVGGALNSLVAPLVLDTVAEYPLTLVALAWLLPIGGPAWVVAELRRVWSQGKVLPSLTVLVLTVAAVIGMARGDLLQRAWWLILLGLLPVYALLLRPRLAHFALTIALVGLVFASGWVSLLPVVDQGRSFFGVVRIMEESGVRVMMHGTTLHGAQQMDPDLRSVPAAYYHPHGPLGRVVTGQGDRARIGFVGLGTGALAVLTRPDQSATFYEIDPLVADMARRHFSYLADARAGIEIQIDDGRVGLAGAPDETFDLLVLDAFSSDSVPAHLLTLEALSLFLKKVKPEGLLVYHISNRQLDLARVFRGWSQTTGQSVAIQSWNPPPPDRGEGAVPTLAVALAPDEATIRRLLAEPDAGWRLLDLDGPAVLWTDERSSLVEVWGQP